ncbi:MAG: pknA3, partial [Blastococcus sp.]|nr:pknA3 [Blastococcus sp.]
GRRAFEGENSVQVAVKHIREEPDPLPADIPPAVRDLVERAMVKDPARRFTDGAALQRAVEQVLAGPAATGTATGTVPIAVPAGQLGTAVMPLSLAAVGTAAAGAPSRAGRRGVVWMLAGALAFLAVVALAVVLFGGDPERPAQEPATTQTTAPTISVAAADYVGRPVAEVQAALVGKGLGVELAPTETAAVPAGQVTAVEPVGDLTAGATVSVTYAVPPVVVPTSPPPAPQPPARQPSGTDPGEEDGWNEGDGDGNEGNGRGNGNGNGKKDD